MNCLNVQDLSHEHDPTYDEEPDKPELTGELDFIGDEFSEQFIHPDWEEGYDYTL